MNHSHIIQRPCAAYRWGCYCCCWQLDGWGIRAHTQYVVQSSSTTSTWKHISWLLFSASSFSHFIFKKVPILLLFHFLLPYTWLVSCSCVSVYLFVCVSYQNQYTFSLVLLPVTHHSTGSSNRNGVMFCLPSLSFVGPQPLTADCCIVLCWLFFLCRFS